MNIDVVILAAGQGTRMKSSKPKVLHAIAGKPMLKHVIDAARQLDKTQIHVVIGHGAEAVTTAIEDEVNFITQEQQLGTGHAVQQALPALADGSTTLILYGDVPLIQTATLSRLLSIAQKGVVALLTVELQDPTGYGRIVRAPNGNVTAIVEHKDASTEQLRIREINTGIMALPTALLQRWLPQLKNSNAQKEYYLTDIIGFAAHDGIPVDTANPKDAEEVQGVNNRMQLAELERYYQHLQAITLMTNGATLYDPTRIDVRGEVTTGTDVTIDINVVFEGKVVLGNNVSIGPNCVLIDCTIGDNVEIKANSIVEGSRVAAECVIGPFARLRPGTDMAKGAKIGNFVETKKVTLGEGSKVNHLTYVGDAEIGKKANIGAGTITCNYDGVNKFKTIIGDHAFIGSNTSLVAPVKVGVMATVGAGSTITGDVGDEQLAVARGKQRNIEGWKRPTKK